MTTSYVSMGLPRRTGPAIERAPVKRSEISGAQLAALPPGVQVGAADADLPIGELAEPRCLATGAHAVEGGAAHADLVEDFGELEHLGGRQD
jgi:hypothetical protein